MNKMKDSFTVILIHVMKRVGLNVYCVMYLSHGTRFSDADVTFTRIPDQTAGADTKASLIR